MTSSWTAPPRAQRSLSLNVAKKGTLNRIRSCVNVADAHRLLVAQVTPPIISYQIVARGGGPLRSPSIYPPPPQAKDSKNNSLGGPA